jgi:hypothetical protein
MKNTTRTRDIALALGRPRKAVLERAEKEGWPCLQKPSGLTWIRSGLPVDVRLSLSLAEQPETALAPAGQAYLKTSQKQRDTADLRCALIAEWKQSGMKVADFVAAYNAGAAGERLRESLGLLAVRTFYQWIREWKQRGLDGLVPRYGQKARGAGETLTESEKVLLEHFWLKDSRPTISHALLLMRENAPYSACSYALARRYLNSLPKPLVDYRRQGRTAFANLHQPFMAQDIFRYKSLDVVVSDHHCLDCVVMYRGRLVRPWVTTMQDYRSGSILGWCPSVAPSSLSITAAYYMAVIRYGIPLQMLFDNGKDYRSELLNGKTVSVKAVLPEKLDEQEEIRIQGIFALVGSEVRFTIPYNGKSKGRQERYFQQLKEYVAKEMAYIGSDTVTRPETAELYFRAINKQAKRNDVPGWEELVTKLDAMISFINDRFPSAGKGMDGKTPSAVFGENLPAEVRKADRDLLRMALSKGELRTVSRNLVKIGGIDYYHPDLFTWSGRQVIARRKLTGDDEVMICDTSGRFICNAVAGYFAEGPVLDESLKRLRSAQKRNLLQLAEMGTGEAAAAATPEYETMLEVAMNKYGYGQAQRLDVDAYLALPQAAGAEQPTPDHTKPRRVLKNPLDATWEDYQ